MSASPAVLLPLRLETRFKAGDLWMRVVPDEPWFVRDDPRITPAEYDALVRYCQASARAQSDQPDQPGAGAPAAWRQLAAQVGAARAARLYRQFVTVAADGTIDVREPGADEQRTDPVLPRVVGFPGELSVWLVDDSGLHQVATLRVDRDRLLADFADPDQSDDRRWWEDWDEAVAVGLAAVVPAAAFTGEIQTLYVAGLGDGDAGELFGALAAEGRLGLLAPGLPTNSVDGAAAAELANDAQTWWDQLHATPGPADSDVSQVLTGDAGRLAPMPGGGLPHRAWASALVQALWPALWGFAAGQVFDVARGTGPAQWAARTLFPEGAYPVLRVGPQPYGLLTTTAWSAWVAAEGDPPLEPAVMKAVKVVRRMHVSAAETRGTAASADTAGLLDLIADTPTSPGFRFRPAWPLELWWLGAAASGLPAAWRSFSAGWHSLHPVAAELDLQVLRPYAARGVPRRLSLPLVVPPGASPADVPALIAALTGTALGAPATFASTAGLDTHLGRPAGSLLLRLLVRSLQLAIGDARREPVFDPEPFSRNQGAAGRLQSLVAAASVPDVTGVAGESVRDVTAAMAELGAVPVPELERRLRATLDCAAHRIDPWLLAAPQRRLDDLVATGARRVLGGYGWVDRPRTGTPGPNAAGMLHTPSPSTALAAAVLRDRALSDPSHRWDLEITSASARAANRIGEEVRAGAQVFEVVGREVEAIVATPEAIGQLRRSFPVRTEHAGRRVCDGVQVLAQAVLPVPLDAEQSAAVALLRTALDTYADLLIAEAVHHLVEGRAAQAGDVMNAASGLSRPPELSILNTKRSGRGVSSSVLIALPLEPALALPSDPAALALLSPAATLDPSVSAYLVGAVGAASEWDFTVSAADGSISTTTLAALGLGPVDALSLTLTTLLRLAAAAAGVADGTVIGGSGPARYEQAATLVSLFGRRPATRRDVAEDRTLTPPGDPADDDLLARYRAVLGIGTALVGELRSFAAGSSPPEAALAPLLAAAAAWGIAPELPDASTGATEPSSTGTPTDPTGARLTSAADQLATRLQAAPDLTAAAAASRAQFCDAAAALVSPTGQLALTAVLTKADLPPLQRCDGVDVDWLPVLAAVRPALAVLEAGQLVADAPLLPWANRPADLWQSDETDARSLVNFYAPPGLDLSGVAGVAAASLDHVDEVIPAADQLTGAAFGFNAPRARAPQAILLAVPPDPAVDWDQAGLAQVLVETRELAHARMARPIDLPAEFWGLAPTALLPGSGATATFREVTL